MHWSDVLISKLSDTVKLVGPTINCEGAPEKGDVTGRWRKNPHVQVRSARQPKFTPALASS